MNSRNRAAKALFPRSPIRISQAALLFFDGGRKIACAAGRIETSGATARESGRRQASVSAVPGVVEHEESDMMSEIQVHVIARQMFEKHGLEAIVQAAQNAQACENKGDTEEAREWRHIEDAMKMMRGPHLS
jgi:hypothetical protein